MTITEQYVRLSDLSIVRHVTIQQENKRYKAVPFDSDELLSMGYAKLEEPAEKGYKGTGKAVKVGSVYQREYVDQTPEEARQERVSALGATDAKMGRFAEDLYDALIAKGLIVPADLPQSAQDIIIDRKSKRGAL